MESSNWPPAHSEALREYFARGMSYSQIADAINAKFGTRYSRNATIGRGKRMGLCTPGRPDHRLAQLPRKKEPKPAKKRAEKIRERRVAEPREPAPAPARERAEPVKLRCVGLSPRLVSLVDLENGECRYPYGGDKDDEAILFCGHPRLAGSSYCKPHFHLTRDSGSESERTTGPVALRLVDAA